MEGFRSADKNCGWSKCVEVPTVHAALNPKNHLLVTWSNSLNLSLFWLFSQRPAISWNMRNYVACIMQVRCAEITNESWWMHFGGLFRIVQKFTHSEFNINIYPFLSVSWIPFCCMNCFENPENKKITCSAQIVMETMITCAVCWLDHSIIAYQVVISRVSLLVILVTRYSCKYWCNFLIYLYFSEFYGHLFTGCHILLLHILWNFFFWTSALYLVYVILLRSTTLMQFL